MAIRIELIKDYINKAGRKLKKGAVMRVDRELYSALVDNGYVEAVAKIKKKINKIEKSIASKEKE